MEKVYYNGYLLEGELTTNNSGFSKWGFATKGGREFFIKEFLSPVYPEDKTLFSERQYKSKIAGCEAFEKEKAEIYSRLNHVTDGNSVIVEDFFRRGGKYYAVTDKVKAIKVQPDRNNMRPDLRFLICRVLAHAVYFMHKQGVVHADIKWDNVMFTPSSGGDCIVGKLIDFDNAFTVENPPDDSDDFNIDQAYCAPETCQFLMEMPVRLNEKIDIYALGILFHQLMTGEFPKLPEGYQYVYEAQMNDKPIVLSSALSPLMHDVITAMLAKDPNERISAEEVLQKLGVSLSEDDDEYFEDTPYLEEVVPEETPEPKPEPEAASEPVFAQKKNGSFFQTAGDL